MKGTRQSEEQVTPKRGSGRIEWPMRRFLGDQATDENIPVSTEVASETGSAAFHPSTFAHPALRIETQAFQVLCRYFPRLP
jgi:hypothetical protein